MEATEKAISTIRESVCALLRIRRVKKEHRHHSSNEIQYLLSFVGTAWCIVNDKYLFTAYHVFNEGKRREPNDKFCAFLVPNNGESAFPFQIIGFPLEDQASDMSIIEIGRPKHDRHLQACPISFAPIKDGSEVVTIGFPAPEIINGSVDENGEINGGAFFLKSHANTGIVSAQYKIGPYHYYEFNVGWHHGESGGPVASINPIAAFAIMQHYRNVQSPHGILPGPHRGIGVIAQQDKLIELGATIV